MPGILRAMACGALQLVVLSVLIVALSASAKAQRGPAMVGVAQVEVEEFAETVPVLGQLIAVTNSVLAARVAGIVESVDMAVGQEVLAGHTLVRLDSTLLEIERKVALASLAEAQAGKTLAESNLELQKLAFDRMDRLRNSAAFSKGRFDDLQQQAESARVQIVQAEARILNAEAALARAEYNIARTSVTAPFDGVIVEKTAQPGQFIGIGAPVATLLDHKNLEIEVEVPTEIVTDLSVGQAVEAIVGDGATQMAVVRAMVPQELVTTRTRPVRLTADFTGDLALAIGQTVTVAIPVGEARAVTTVPKDALVSGARGWSVYTIQDGKAVPKEVTIGDAVGDRFVVESGLSEADIVVIRGNERLRPGQDIQAMPGNESEQGVDGDASQQSPSAQRPATANEG